MLSLLGIFLKHFLTLNNFFFLTHCKENKNHDNWLKNKKVIQSQKMPQKFKFFSLKNFPNKVTKYKQNYMEGLYSRNKN